MLGMSCYRCAGVCVLMMRRLPWPLLLGLAAPRSRLWVSLSPSQAGRVEHHTPHSASLIFVNWQGLPFTQDTIVSLDVNFGQVPEPATLTLLALAFTGLALARRRNLH